ncbi:hypothetical protein ACOSP7_020006 [Xanthoceras sorbifolium]
MVNLREHNVPAPVHCPLCRCAPETTIHALWSCCLLKPVRHSFIEEFRAAVNVDRTITTTNTVMVRHSFEAVSAGMDPFEGGDPFIIFF